MTRAAALAFPKPIPQCLVKADAKREADRNWRAVCKATLTRDHDLCRICGARRTDPHHIVPRSVGGADTTRNVLRTCRRCHQWRHAGLLRIVGNADRRVQVTWDARVSSTGRERTDWR